MSSRLLSVCTVALLSAGFASTMASAASQTPPSAPVTVVNTTANPVPVTGSVGVAGGITISNSSSNPVPVSIQDLGSVSTTSGDKTVLVGEFVLDVTGTDPANFRTPAIDVSPYKLVRVVVSLGNCTLCSTATVTVLNPFLVDRFTIPITGGEATQQAVYEIPGEQLNVAIGNAAANTISSWLIRVYGRRN